MFSKVLKATLCGATAIAAATVFTGCVVITNQSNLNDIKCKSFSNSFNDKNFTKIDADIDWGILEIKPSTDNKVYVDATDVPDSFTAEIKNDTLVVDFNTDSTPKKVINKKTNITIKVPEKDYNKLNLKLGAGETSVKDLTINSIDINCGACELNMDDIKATKALKLKGGAGEITISESTLGSLDANLGIGEFSFNGTINGDIDVKCGIGDADIDLTNPKSDFEGKNSKYSLNLKEGLGDINITYSN